MAAVTVGSAFVFDLLPGKSSDEGNSAADAYSPAPSASSPEAGGTGLPAIYIGTWEGPGAGLDGALPMGTFRVTVHKADVGEELGKLRQTDVLGGICVDILTLKQVKPKEIVATSVGAKSNHGGCNPTPHTIRLTPTGDDLTYTSDSAAEGKPVARMSKVK
jgi:hypothetical protein